MLDTDGVDCICENGECAVIVGVKLAICLGSSTALVGLIGNALCNISVYKYVAWSGSSYDRLGNSRVSASNP